ncbi:MAG: Do family serine endopeptidase [Ignavibacteria bacterium]|nr:Do family serine endopeptidase [Ignavibacteria bacterium]MBL7992608.1 Do family serine endopeptidase [Candidatus Kapabacteria bacterium]
MKNRPMLAALVLVALGVVIGAAIVSFFGEDGITSAFAQVRKRIELGSGQPPVKIESSAQVLNNAFVAVSKAVNPSVVTIAVVTERKADPRMKQFEDFFGFRFFGPNQRGQRGQPQQQPEEQDDEEQQGFRSQGSGSGVILTGDGFIVTNNHVIEDAKDITVTTFDGHELKAKLIGRDELTDLAVIKVEPKSGITLTPSFVGNSDEVQVGEWVVAVGNPFGTLQSTITAGIVSAKGRGLSGRGGYNVENYIQTDAAINPGNSGGGLFNLEGKLIGINTAIATRTGAFQGYGFAIPVNLMRSVVEDLLDDGKINRGYIGVQITSVNEATAKAVGLDKISGVMVQEVMKNSAGKAAGLQEGDVILEVDGVPVKTSNELQSLVSMRRAGDNVNLAVWRDGKRITKTVTLKARDDEKEIVAEAGRPSTPADKEQDNAPIKFDNLGFTVEPLTGAQRKELDISSGVVISKVTPYGEAAKIGLRPGAVILKADKQLVQSAKQFQDILTAKRGQAVLLQVKDGSVVRLVGLEVPRQDG